MRNAKRRVVFFIGTLHSGGAERVVSILSSGFAEHGWDVDIVTYFDGPIFHKIDAAVRVVCIKHETRSNNIIKNIAWLRKYIKNNATVLVSFLVKFNIMAILAGIGLKIPTIVSERTDPRLGYGLPLKVLRNIAYRKADLVVVQSGYAKSCFKEPIRRKTVVIFNPIKVDDYVGKALNTPKNKKIVSVGRLIRSKNQKLLIDAFSEIVNEFPEYELVIYGEGECREELEEQIQRLGLSQAVFLPGNERRVLAKICDAELFVLTSNYEGMPNALLEAMCVGLPVISTRVAGATDIIKEGENGMLINVGSKNQLEHAIKKLLKSSMTRKQYGIKAIELSEQLDIDIILSQWEKVINDAIHNEA